MAPDTTAPDTTAPDITAPSTSAPPTTAATRKAPASTASTTILKQFEKVQVHPASKEGKITQMQQCLCTEFSKKVSANFLPALLCDPHSENGILVCRKNKVELGVCSD